MVRIEQIGEYAFLTFVILALILGIAIGYMAWPESGIAAATVSETRAWTILILLILGIVVGFITITEKEATAFLIAAIALIVIRTEIFEYLYDVELLEPMVYIMREIMTCFVAFVAPAAVILAVKAVFALARKK